MMSFVVSGTPGPNMLLVMSSSARHGPRQSLPAMAGCMTALMLMMGISAAGLGLAAGVSAVFDVLRWIGAAYLIYLGIKSWQAPIAATAEEMPPATADPPVRCSSGVSWSRPAIPRPFCSPRHSCRNSLRCRRHGCRSS